MSRIDEIRARYEALGEFWTQRDASAAFTDRAFLLGRDEAQEEWIAAAKAELKFLRGERKTLLKNLESWESQGHTNVTFTHLRRFLAKKQGA